MTNASTFAPTSQARTPALVSRLPRVGTTIFTVMSALAAEKGAVNLGQGFPDFDCDPQLVEAVTGAMQRLAKHVQRITHHVDHAGVVVDIGVGRQRQIGQQQSGQAALAALAPDVDRR